MDSLNILIGFIVVFVLILVIDRICEIRQLNKNMRKGK